MSNYVVKRGECLSSVAERFGFSTWKSLADDPGNAALKKKRPNPNLLVPGDAVAIPSKKKQTLSASTGSTATFKVAFPKTRLRLHLWSATGQKLATAPYRLVVGKQTLEGTTDGDGLLDVPVPARLMAAKLTLTLPAPAPPPKPADDGLVLPKETFKVEADPDHPALLVPEPKSLLWQLTPGTLFPPDTIVGQQNRLHNLGYRCAVDGVVGPETEAATRAFQADRKLPLGPMDDKTRAELEKVHDQGAA